MTEAEGRAAVVAEARSWLGTPWRHRAMVKGAGVDCAQLLIGVYAGAGLVERFDTGEYPRDWHIHKHHERMAPIVQRFCAPIAEAEAGPSDIVLVRIGHVFSHAAILTAWPEVVHADVLAGAVTLGDLDRDLTWLAPRRERRWFSFWRGEGLR